MGYKLVRVETFELFKLNLLIQHYNVDRCESGRHD